LKIKDIKDYDTLVDIIYDNEAYIEKNYQSKDDQILIHEELLVILLKYLQDSKYNSLDKKKIIKLLIKDVLELQNSDVIIIKEKYIFIKLYDDLKRLKVASNQQNTKANRFNGIQEEELKSFYDEYFDNEDIKIFFKNIASNFVQKYFLDKQISNEAYEKDVFKLIQKLIIKDLSSEFECNLEFHKGFSGYIFRKHFRLVFQYITNLLLKEVVNSNSNTIEFLKYYSLNIIVKDGVKYKIPEFIADNGVRWHIVSIIAIAKNYINIKELINNKETSINEINKEIEGFHIDGVSPIKHNADNFEKFKKLDLLIKNNEKKIEILRDSLEICTSDEEADVLEDELNKLQDERILLRKNKSTLNAQKVKQLSIDRYNALASQIELLKKEISAKYKILNQSKESFDSVTSALINALISKRKVIN
jgi:hypothetical protein